MSHVPDADNTHEQTVYRCYDKAGQLLYIGCTSDLDYRLTLHNPLVLRETREIVTESYSDRLSGREAERAAIKAEAPLLNKHHNPTRFTAQGGGGFVPVEPVHPLTAELLRQGRPVTMDEKYEALKKVGDILFPNGWPARADA